MLSILSCQKIFYNKPHVLFTSKSILMQKFQIEKELASNCSKWEIEFTQINCQRKNAFPKNLFNSSEMILW